MKKRLLVLLSVTLLVGITASIPSAASSTEPQRLDPLGFGLAVLNGVPEPVFDPLDPPGFFRVQATEFDPARTQLVQGTWLNGIGCPTNVGYAIYPSTAQNATYEDTGCPTGDPKDQHVEGLLLAKTGPTANNASAVAELHNVKGTVLTELGWDIRKGGGLLGGPQGSHCGAGAPRWDITTTTKFYFIGCNSPPGAVTATSTGWTRMRWSPVVGFCASCPGFPLEPITEPVTRIQIVFDEGTDIGPDFLGAAILDNIDVNGALVGHGNVDAD